MIDKRDLYLMISASLLNSARNDSKFSGLNGIFWILREAKGSFFTATEIPLHWAIYTFAKLRYMIRRRRRRRMRMRRERTGMIE